MMKITAGGPSMIDRGDSRMGSHGKLVALPFGAGGGGMFINKIKSGSGHHDSGVG
jgi:hypothetical protein